MKGTTASPGSERPLALTMPWRGGLLEAVRRADGEHRVADLELARVAQAHRRQVLGVDAQHRDVGHRVGAQHLGRELAPVARA